MTMMRETRYFYCFFGAMVFLLPAFLFPLAPAKAEGPGGMPEAIYPPEDFNVIGSEREKWLAFTAEETGVLMVFTHSSDIDLILEIYPEDWRRGAFGRVDDDIQNSGNELGVIQVEKDQMVYVRIAPRSEDDYLADHFKVLSAFVPGDNFRHPFLDLRR